MYRLTFLLPAVLLFAASASAEDAPVSFYKDVRPVLVSNCNACHKPDKMKAELDMTTFAGLMKGGSTGTRSSRASRTRASWSSRSPATSRTCPRTATR